ncbi:class I SAM-dependent methyltransferase [Sphingomonas rustica]
MGVQQNRTDQHPRVAEWLQIEVALERQLQPLGNAAIAALGLSRAERVLDLGCGIGRTSQAIAGAVGGDGYVLGIDVIQCAIDVQQSRIDNPSQLVFECGDVETYRFEPGSFDAAFSRFGTMFFNEPVAAFANVRKAVRSGGRLAFVCWRDLAANELDHLPLRAVAHLLPGELVDETQGAGWFSLSDPKDIRRTLDAAGFIEIDVHAHDLLVSAGDLPSTVAVCSRVGALGAILRRHPHLRSRTASALKRALRERDGRCGTDLRAAVWIVVAHVP